MALRRGEVTDIQWVFCAVGNKMSHISLTLHRVVIMARSYHSIGCLQATKQIFESVAQSSRLIHVAIWEVLFF